MIVLAGSICCFFDHDHQATSRVDSNVQYLAELAGLFLPKPS